MNHLYIDFNNLAMRCLFAPGVTSKVCPPNYDLWGHIVFATILKELGRFNPDRVVVAVDDGNSWRKMVWPRYKEHRAEKKSSMSDKFDIDWGEFFMEFNILLDDLKKSTPLMVYQHRLAEADDIIAVLVMEEARRASQVVYSVDEDYLQLYPLAKIWNPLKEKYVEPEHKSPEMWLQKKCLTGQAKDNIFNAKTPDNWGLTPETDGKRKPGLGPKTADKIVGSGNLEKWLRDNKAEENYRRNQQLIDFRRIPKVLQKSIVEGAWKLERKFYPDQLRAIAERRMWMQTIDNFDKVCVQLEPLSA